MSKCISCAWFPWKPGTDFSMTPVARCHTEIKERRWTNESAETENQCPHFKAVNEDDTNTAAEGKTAETPKRSNTGRKK